jgi:hypothetical protein
VVRDADVGLGGKQEVAEKMKETLAEVLLQKQELERELRNLTRLCEYFHILKPATPDPAPDDWDLIAKWNGG